MVLALGYTQYQVRGTVNSFRPRLGRATAEVALASSLTSHHQSHQKQVCVCEMMVTNPGWESVAAATAHSHNNLATTGSSCRDRSE